MWACNLDSVQVFQLCSLQAVGTMAGLYWQSIDPTQIRASLLLLRIPRCNWTAIALDVNHMGDFVANSRNQQLKAKPRR